MQQSGNNVLFVTNEDEIVNLLSNQLILLRNIDCILIRLYTDAVQTIDSEKPLSIIITCSSKDEEAECLETIKLMKRHTIVPIILILREYNEDFVKLANQAGINDVVTVEYGNSEILMRTIWSLQKNEMRESLKKHVKLLEQLKVIDAKTGFYTAKNNKRIVTNELDYIKENNLDAIILGITPNRNSGLTITKEKLDEAIKDNVRGSDTTIMYNESTYYIMLLNTNLSGAMIVWTRINNGIGAEGTVCGCITDVEGKSYEQLETLMTNGLEVALTTPNNFIAISDDAEDEEEWLDNPAQKNKPNLKLFKQIYEKKLENTIKPILEFAKKSAKRKLPKISFEILYEPSKVKMVISKKEKISTLEIEHKGSSFIAVSFVHSGLDSPENRKIKIDFNEINEQSIKDVIDIFMKDYLSYAS